MVNKKARRSRRNAHLPQELVTEVLLRRPVESLLRFKCVCKDWYTMISDPQFAKAQLRQAKPASGLIGELFKAGDNIKKLVILSYFDVQEENGGGVQIDFSIEELDVILKDSCNGLLLLLLSSRRSNSAKQYYVYNPITRWNLKLPQFRSGNYVNELRSSLVYDDSNQKYKVVITLCKSKSIFQWSYECWVFTLGEKGGGGGGAAAAAAAAAADGKSSYGRWRKLDMPATCSIIRCKLLSANGALHWFVCRISEAEFEKKYILLMDLASEEFRLISRPTTPNHCANLLKMKGSLCLSHRISEHQLDLWVLTDPVKQVWNKQYSINFRLFTSKCQRHDYMFCPVLVMENSSPVIIFVFGFIEGLLCYNLDNGQFKEVQKGMVKRSDGIFLHVNSLINC